MHINRQLPRAFILCGGAALALAACTGTTQAQTLTTSSAAQAIAISGGSSGGGSSGGGNTQRIVSTPGVIAPSFYGANPCSNSASGGGAGMGFGFSIGGQWTERECRAMDNFRMLTMGGHARLAMAHLCDRMSDLRRVAAEIGEPCPQDGGRPVAVLPAATVAASQATRPAYCRPDVANSECQ